MIVGNVAIIALGPFGNAVITSFRLHVRMRASVLYYVRLYIQRRRMRRSVRIAVSD